MTFGGCTVKSTVALAQASASTLVSGPASGTKIVPAVPLLPDVPPEPVPPVPDGVEQRPSMPQARPGAQSLFAGMQFCRHAPPWQ
jgi:hypothetical protein